MSNNNVVYCYETKEKFNSQISAAKSVGLLTSVQIRKCIDKHNKTANGYHFCTDLSIFNNLYLTNNNNKLIYCYETKERFNSITLAKKSIGVKIPSIVVNNPNKTAGGFHWCTDLSIFDGVELVYFLKQIYCYETKEKFNSLMDIYKLYNIKHTSILKCLNNPSRTSNGFHWCSDLNIFDGIDLTKYIKIIYCYETKEKFKSLADAARSSGLRQRVSIWSVVNDHKRTAGGFHWCTDLSIFDGVELLYNNTGVSSYEFEIVDFLKSNNITNIITSDRKILKGKELDIYLPDYNLAIEFNGDYWHSVEILSTKSKTYINYHQDKTLKCIENDIDLISIFEFQYNTNKELYLNYILDRINGIDRPDLELDENNNHNLQFCNKKYFTEKQDISEPQLFSYEKYKVYDCGKLTFKEIK